MAGVGHLKRVLQMHFLKRSAFWSIRLSGLLIQFVRDRCSTSYDLASLFRGRRNTLNTFGMEQSQNTMARGCQLCTQLLIFEGIDVVNLEKIGTLRFCCCHLREVRRSLRLVKFLMLSSPRLGEVS